MGYTIVDTQVRGVNYRLHTDINTTDGKLLTSSKFYDRKEIKALAAALPQSSTMPAVFVDIGANTGYYSLTLAKIIVIEDCNRNLWQHDIVQEIVQKGYTVSEKTRGNQILKKT